MTFFPGQRVNYAQFGEGVIVAVFRDGRAQVYNLVLGDTLEGRIFLLLTDN
jgi:hypothetical protein